MERNSRMWQLPRLSMMVIIIILMPLYVGNGDMQGYLDELRLSVVARSADWVWATYNDTFQAYELLPQPRTVITVF